MAERKKKVPVKRTPRPRKPTLSNSKQEYSEKRIIFGTAFLVLVAMVVIHLSGCVNDLKAEKIARS